MKILKKIYNWQKNIPDKKKWIEVIGGLISIPMMTTILFVNLTNIKKSRMPVEPTPTPAVTILPVEIKTITDSNGNQTPVVSTDSGVKIIPCKKEVGPFEIISPRDGEVITKDFVNIDFDNKRDGYCPVTWSYRINSGSWSDYTDKAISLQNISSGPKTLEVKVKSTVANQEILLKRSFTVGNTPTITPTPTTAQPTPTITPVPTQVGTTQQ